MKAIFAIALVAAAMIGAVSATSGVDVSQLFPTSSWSCLANNGYIFGIIRCYCSTGQVDGNCAQSVANAWAGGMQYVDLYLFPCPQCGNAYGQVETLRNYINNNNVRFGQVWLDVEGSQYWLGDYGSNQVFFEQLCNATESLFGSPHWGIYSSPSQWYAIFGSDWNKFANKPLWWPRYDNVPSLSYNWQNFAGWTKPNIKQYHGTTTVCSMSVDLDFY